MADDKQTIVTLGVLGLAGYVGWRMLRDVQTVEPFIQPPGLPVGQAWPTPGTYVGQVGGPLGGYVALTIQPGGQSWILGADEPGGGQAWTSGTLTQGLEVATPAGPRPTWWIDDTARIVHVTIGDVPALGVLGADSDDVLAYLGQPGDPETQTLWAWYGDTAYG